MACSICGKSQINRTMAPTRSTTVPQKNGGFQPFSGTAPAMTSHSRPVSTTVTPGVTTRVPKVGQ